MSIDYGVLLKPMPWAKFSSYLPKQDGMPLINLLSTLTLPCADLLAKSNQPEKEGKENNEAYMFNDEATLHRSVIIDDYSTSIQPNLP